MKININQIPPEGIKLEEELLPAGLEIESEGIEYLAPVKIRAEISKITNVVVGKLFFETKAKMICSRCLEGFEFVIKKDFPLDYALGNVDLFIDFNPDIRQEIILGLPFKPLCKADCRGLCAKCGKNLNLSKCNC